MFSSNIHSYQTSISIFHWNKRVLIELFSAFSEDMIIITRIGEQSHSACFVCWIRLSYEITHTKNQNHETLKHHLRKPNEAERETHSFKRTYDYRYAGKPPGTRPVPGKQQQQHNGGNRFRYL